METEHDRSRNKARAFRRDVDHVVSSRSRD